MTKVENDLRVWHYLHYGWYLGEAPREPDDIRDCAERSRSHRHPDCPYCKAGGER